MVILLVCRRCKGSGMVTNEDYQVCISTSSDAIKKYYQIHLHSDDENHAANENQYSDCQNIPRNVTCPICDGDGVLEFSEEEWEVKVEPDEEIPSE